jgi:hypothetical protein
METCVKAALDALIATGPIGPHTPTAPQLPGELLAGLSDPQRKSWLQPAGQDTWLSSRRASKPTPLNLAEWTQHQTPQLQLHLLRFQHRHRLREPEP